MKHLAALVALVVMTGCASVITDPSEIAALGPKPDQAKAEDVVRFAVKRMPLKDPYSAIVGGITVEGPVKRPGYKSGWQISFWLNAKNSFGGYVGAKKYNLVLQPNGDYLVTPADAWNP